MNSKYLTIIIFLAILALISQIKAMSIDVEEPYAIMLDIARYGIKPKYISIIDVDRFMVIGSINNTNVVSILSIIDPYKGLKIEQIYPLVGEPTAIATNGFPVKRIAVGSSKGEVLLFSVERGRVVGALYTIIGADFYVNKIAILRTTEGGYRVATLISEGGPRTYPCVSCYIYIFSEDGRGILRIGPRLGNATIVYSGINIQDMAPLRIYTPTEIYNDASRLLIAYTPLTKTILMNITLYINNTYVPAANALIEVLIYNRTAIPQSIIRYGVNTDSRGIARIPLPLAYGDRTYVNISIRDRAGITIYSYSLTPRDILISDEIILPDVILTREPDTRDARRVYGTPPLLKMIMEILDVSNAPMSYRSIAISTFRLDLDATGLIFMSSSEAMDYIFSYTYPSRGMLIVSALSIENGKIMAITNSSDYIGVNAYSVDGMVYSGNAFIHIALSDGRIRTYQRVAGMYRLINIYNIGGVTKKLLAFPTATGYTYLAISPIGLQMVSVDPYLLPLLRNYISITASVESLIDCDALADLSSSVMVNSTKMLIIRHLDKLLPERTPITLDRIMAPTIRLRILLPGNESVNKVYVNFSYPQGYIMLKPTPNGIVTIPNILPKIRYNLYIWYQEPYIQPINMTLIINKSSTINIDVTMRYREYNVTLILRDPHSNRLIAPYKIVVDRKTIIRSSIDSSVTLRLIYGRHNIEILPADGYEMVYKNISIQIFVDRDQTINIDMVRKTYRVDISILDLLTNSTIIAPIRINIDNIVKPMIIQNRSISIILPYGNHTLEIYPAKEYENVYKPMQIALSVTGDRVLNIFLERRVYTVELRLLDQYIKHLIAPIDIYLNGTLAKQNVGNETTILVPYGIWRLRIAPSKGFEGSYNILEQVIKVMNNEIFTFVLNRTEYKVTININDEIGRIVAPIELYITGIVNRTVVIESTPYATLYLPYGTYTIIAKPAKGYENVYKPTNITIDVKSPRIIAITMNRIRYSLSISMRDVCIGILRGMFDIYVNGTKVADRVSASTTISLPYGVYTIQAVPMPAFIQQYEPSKTVVVKLFNSTSIEIPITRRMYLLRIIVQEGETPIKNAEIAVISMEGGAVFTKLITDEYGIASSKVCFGSYRIVVSHPSYETKYMIINVDSDTQEIVYMIPTTITYINRFLPIAIILIAIGIIIYVGLRIRASITKRLMAEEEVF